MLIFYLYFIIILWFLTITRYSAERWLQSLAALTYANFFFLKAKHATLGAISEIVIKITLATYNLLPDIERLSVHIIYELLKNCETEHWSLFYYLLFLTIVLDMALHQLSDKGTSSYVDNYCRPVIKVIEVL